MDMQHHNPIVISFVFSGHLIRPYKEWLQEVSTPHSSLAFPSLATHYTFEEKVPIQFWGKLGQTPTYLLHACWEYT